MGKIDLNKMGLSGRIGPIIAYVTKGGKQAFRQYTVPSDPKTPKSRFPGETDSRGDPRSIFPTKIL